MMRAAPCVPILAMTLVLAASAAASAQGPASPPVLAPVEPIRFDRPESWALKYFASATLMAGLETPHTRRPGAVSIGMEFGWLPRLSSAQQQVGFNGMDTLDLNSAPLLARPRVTVGLPGRFSVVLSATPPVRFFGVTPLLVALAVERPIVETAAWTIGVRGYGQMGHVNAAFTCPQDVVQFAPGSPGNAGGCHAASSDAATLRFAGAEVGTAPRQTPRRAGCRRTRPCPSTTSTSGSRSMPGCSTSSTTRDCSRTAPPLPPARASAGESAADSRRRSMSSTLPCSSRAAPEHVMTGCSTCAHWCPTGFGKRGGRSLRWTGIGLPFRLRFLAAPSANAQGEHTSP
jgi:hypothetical protein